MLNEWDSRFLELARFVGEWSRDRSRKVGCVIVGSSREIRAIGYNGFPRGADDSADERYDRPAKYLWTEHAERNAIFQAARVGIQLEGCTMYLPWFPCMDCARAIVQSGIKRLIAIRPDAGDPEWGAQFQAALALLTETEGLQIDWADARSTKDHESAERE
jgi:dCMP deaminase